MGNASACTAPRATSRSWPRSRSHPSVADPGRRTRVARHHSQAPRLRVVGAASDDDRGVRRVTPRKCFIAGLVALPPVAVAIPRLPPFDDGRSGHVLVSTASPASLRVRGTRLSCGAGKVTPSLAKREVASTRPLPSRFGRKRWQPTATVLACFRSFRGLRICRRLRSVAPARLHKRSIIAARIPDEKRDSASLGFSFGASSCSV
jgi:hypothetical protein